MTAFDDYGAHDGLGLAALVKRGEVTAGKVLEAAWAAIDRLNPDINAITASMRDIAERDEACPWRDAHPPTSLWSLGA